MAAESEFVRKRDFRIEIGFDQDTVDNTVRARELVGAIHLITPSMLSRRVIMEIYQPIYGNVHSTVMSICQSGIKILTLKTLIPGHPELNDHDDCGNIAYNYRDGKAIEQVTQMSNDELVGDQFMVHILCLEFETASVNFNEFDIARPRISLVAN